MHGVQVSAHLHPMTTLALASTANGRATATPVVEYDQARRAQARAAGRPTDRTLAPGIFGELREKAPVDVALVWTDQHGSLTYFCEAEARTPARLTITALDKALSLPPRDANDPEARYPDLEHPRRLVVADYSTLRRIMAWVNVAASTTTDGDYTAASVLRRLQVSSRLVASTRLIVLTRALARKFWLGAQYDPEDFGAWRRAFGFGSGATTLSIMKGMVDLASEGKVHAKFAREAFASESYALCSAAFPGLGSAVAAFRRTETADNAARAILTTDPLLRDRGLLDGSLSTLRIMEYRQDHFTATVSTPFKLRPGKQVLLIDPSEDAPGAWAETHLDAVTVARIGDQDQLIARVALGSGRVRTALSTLMSNVMATGSGRTLLVTEAPYLPFAGADKRATRWTQAASTRIESDRVQARPRRDIPLDVIVAGSPTT